MTERVRKETVIDFSSLYPFVLLLSLSPLSVGEFSDSAGETGGWVSVAPSTYCACQDYKTIVLFVCWMFSDAY